MSFPKALDYSIKKIASQYSCNTIKVPTIQSKSTLTQLDTFTFELPANSLIDLRTFALYFNVSTNSVNTKTNYMPKHFQTLIDQININCNGADIQTISNLQHLMKIKYDYNLPSDKTVSAKNIYCGHNLKGDGDHAILEDNGSAFKSGTQNANNVPVILTDFVGLLGSGVCLSTKHMGQVRVTFRLSPNTVLLATTNGEGTYTVTNMNALMNVVSLGDVYNRYLDSMLSAGVPLKVAYKHYTTFQGNSGIRTQTLRGTITSESIDALYGFFTPTTPVQTYVAQTETSGYFTRDAELLTSSQFTIDNSTFYPSFLADPHETFLNTMVANNHSHTDMVGGSDVDLNSKDRFLRFFFVHNYRINYQQNGDEMISGFSTQGVPSNIEWKTASTSTNAAVPNLIVEETKVLNILPFKQCSTT